MRLFDFIVAMKTLYITRHLDSLALCMFSNCVAVVSLVVDDNVRWGKEEGRNQRKSQKRYGIVENV